MQNFRGVQRTFTCTQINQANINEVFPLLCPVREKEWVDGWDYKMIHSKSGLIEKDCVFTTPHHHELEILWYVTQYSTETFTIEFVRFTPGVNTVRINIELEPIDAQSTYAHISYQYTALSEEQNEFLQNHQQKEFEKMMAEWELSINKYLKENTFSEST